MEEEILVGDYYDSEKDAQVAFYDAIIKQTKTSTLFCIGKEEIWLPLKFTYIEEHDKSITMPQWLYDQNFI